jgi:hypothetical protein
MNKTVAFLALAGIASAGFGQTATFVNAGFEQTCFFCGGPFPEGWHSPGNDQIAKQRFVGDGASPAFFPVGTPNAITPRTGNAVASIGTYGSGGFEGLTTDTVNFCYCNQSCTQACPAPFPFFDPFFDYTLGDVVVRGYYMIPANDPIVGDQVGIKVNVKVGFQDVATTEVLNISGHTNGQWTPIEIIFPRSEIQQQYDCNRGAIPECGCNCVPNSPLPNHTKITFFRFAGDGTPTSGTVYFDDFTYQQLPSGPSCNDVDFNNDGSSFDPQDIDAFLSVFSEGPCIPETNTCDAIDFNNDGSLFDPCDIDSFLVVFSEGPCTLCGV